MSEMNAFKQKEKIIKMKLQTAKILWAEDRKEATFLILESIDDPRANELRERMGFDDDFEVGHTHRSSSHPLLISIGLIMLLTMSFLMGTYLDLNGGTKQKNPVVDQNELIETLIAPSPEASEPMTQTLLELTETADPIQLTQSAIEKEQNSSMSLLDATETARYAQSTATENARETQTSDD